MRNESGVLVEFLRERNLLCRDDSGLERQARERLERSGLVPLMQQTCVSINQMVGGVMVDAHAFLPGEPVLCCFVFVEDGTEYVMRLELQGAIPILIFAERKWRDTLANDFVRWAYRLAEIEPVSISIKMIYEFREERIEADSDQVQTWFRYLISGFDRSYGPSF